MLFHKKYQDVYLYGIKAVAEELGFICERVDERVFTEDILDEIHKGISEADIVIADLTGNNPNVYYEVGYAHGIKKTVILLTENAEKIHFDLRNYRSIVYYGHIHKLQHQLKKMLTEINKKMKQERG